MEDLNYQFLRKFGFIGGSERYEFRNFREVKNGNWFGLVGIEDLFWSN